MSDTKTRIIKKYPNRRLYDTEESRYITLADVRRLVLDKVDFVVIDKKSQKDITRSILLQVISDQELKGEPVMSRDFLSQVIRSYGSVMPDFVSSYLEQSLKLFASQQQQVREKVRDVVGVDPVGWSVNSPRRIMRAGNRCRKIFSRPLTAAQSRIASTTKSRKNTIKIKKGPARVLFFIAIRPNCLRYAASSPRMLRRIRPWRSTSSTLTLITSPSFSLSETFSTRSSDICEMCTRPSLPGKYRHKGTEIHQASNAPFID